MYRVTLVAPRDTPRVVGGVQVSRLVNVRARVCACVRLVVSGCGCGCGYAECSMRARMWQQWHQCIFQHVTLCLSMPPPVDDQLVVMAG